MFPPMASLLSRWCTPAVRCLNQTRCVVTSKSRSAPEVERLLARYTRYKQTPVTLRQLLEIGASDELESYKFLRGEIPTRLSHAIVELESIPGALLEQPSIREIVSKYRQSFLELLDLPNAREIGKMPARRKPEILTEFSERLERILKRHANVVATMGLGILELKQSGLPEEELICLKEFLDRFYMSRIGLRTHMEQHLVIYNNKTVAPDSNWVGIFNLKCDVRSIVLDAVDYAAGLCKQNYSDAPDVIINTPQGEDCSIVYCPSHLHYMMSELLKNSMRAVIEFHGEDKLEYPPIIVDLFVKDRELVIKISDRGGGIPQQIHPKLFSYIFSTAHSPDMAKFHGTESHFAGFGYGLALSRLHARYFGGEMVLCPIHGYGTDCFIYIRNADQASEVLPTLDLATLKRYASSGNRIPNFQHWTESQRQAMSIRRVRTSGLPENQSKE